MKMALSNLPGLSCVWINLVDIGLLCLSEIIAHTSPHLLGVIEKIETVLVVDAGNAVEKAAL